MNHTKQHFSTKHLDKIKNLIKDERYNKALDEYNIYFNNFPYDALSKLHYIDLLIKLGRFEEAEEVFNILEGLNSYNRIDMNLYYILLVKLKCYQKEFIYANELINENYLENLNFISKIEKAYISKQLGKNEPNIPQNNSYLINQILNYKEERMLEHLNKHTFCSNNINESKFYDTFPLLEVISYIKQYLPTKNRICSSITCYTDIFKYRSCGENNGNLADYFKVVVLNDTNQIITMFPCLPAEVNDYIDLSYLNRENEQEKSSAKVKKMTPIEKFNRKYGLQ